VTDQGLAHLKTLTGLKSLNLGQCDLTGQGLVHLSGMKQLEYIGLSGCHDMTDQGFKHIGDLTSLVTLHAGGRHVTDQGIKHIKRLTRLERLVLSNCMKDQSVVHLDGLDKLRFIGLCRSSGLTDLGIMRMLVHTEVQTIDLSGCCVTIQGLDSLISRGYPKKLRTILLFECPKISRQETKQFRHWEQLEIYYSVPVVYY
jgi:hypothetical protein